MIEIWMKMHFRMSNFFLLNKEWHIMLALHVVLVTLHGRFTISIDQDK